MKIKYIILLAAAVFTISFTGCMEKSTKTESKPATQETTQASSSESTSATASTSTPTETTASTGATQSVSSDSFSYNVPSDWTVMSVPGTNFKTAMSPNKHNNINVVTQPYEGQIADYVDMSLKQVETTFKNFKKVSQAPFKTESGLEGLKVVTDNNVTGQNIRQVMYFLKADGNMNYVITCTALAAEATNAESMFDDVVKTFTIKK